MVSYSGFVSPTQQKGTGTYSKCPPAWGLALNYCMAFWRACSGYMRRDEIKLVANVISCFSKDPRWKWSPYRRRTERPGEQPEVPSVGLISVSYVKRKVLSDVLVLLCCFFPFFIFCFFFSLSHRPLFFMNFILVCPYLLASRVWHQLIFVFNNSPLLFRVYLYKIAKLFCSRAAHWYRQCGQMLMVPSI